MHLSNTIAINIKVQLHDVARRIGHGLSPAAALPSFAHHYYVAARLLTACVGFIALTLSLVFTPHPSLFALAIVAHCCAPFIASVYVLRGGPLSRAHKVTSLFYLLSAILCALCGPSAQAPAFIFLALGCGEALVSTKTQSLGFYFSLAGLSLGVSALILAELFILQPAKIYVSALTWLGLLQVIAFMWEHLTQHNRYSEQARATFAHHHYALASFPCIYGLHDAKAQLTSLLAAPPAHLEAVFNHHNGAHILDHIHIADRPAYLKALSDTLHAQKAHVVQIRLNLRNAVHQSPEFHVFDVHMSPYARDDYPLMSCWLPATREALGDKGAAPEEWKDQILAMMSHELRTPLNAIIGFSEILADPYLAGIHTDKRLEYAGLIHQSGNHLLDVVNSILDMSKLHAGHFDLNAESFDLHSLIDQCCSLLALNLTDLHISLTHQRHDGVLILNADRKACKQIIINLLSNAIKFSNPHSVITIGTERIGNSAVLTFADTGIGIAADDLPFIGNPFFQAKKDYDRAYEGTGLGLAVVKGLVTLHKGSLSIESAVNHGTCVRVSLPLNVHDVAQLPHTQHTIEYLSQHRLASPAAVQSTLVKKIA